MEQSNNTQLPAEVPQHIHDKINAKADEYESATQHDGLGPAIFKDGVIYAMAYAKIEADKSLQAEYTALKERLDKMEAALEWIKTYGPDQSKEGQAFIDKALAGKDAAFTGSNITSPAPGISLGCISPEARDLLDSVMEAWGSHYKKIKEMHGEKHEPTFYGFAYWLIRWSGLIQPLNNPTK